MLTIDVYKRQAQGRPFFIRRNKPMKLTFEEKKLLYTYGCADLELTRKRLYDCLLYTSRCV